MIKEPVQSLGIGCRSTNTEFIPENKKEKKISTALLHLPMLEDGNWFVNNSLCSLTCSVRKAKIPVSSQFSA